VFSLYVRKNANDKARWICEDKDENYLCEEVGNQYISSGRYERVMVVQHQVNKPPILIMSWNWSRS